MKSAKVVIGANYGDEGKGMVTDWLCSRSSIKPLVVRFNGGAQAGHTVITPEGQRHVFGHIGSGSFLGCPTHLSRFFISNPILLLSELNEFGRNIEISVDPESIVTTPYDMVINQIALLNEGVNTSCGVGINETVTRSDTINLQIKDLSDALEEKLLVINYFLFNFLTSCFINSSHAFSGRNFGIPAICIVNVSHVGIAGVNAYGLIEQGFYSGFVAGKLGKKFNNF